MSSNLQRVLREQVQNELEVSPKPVRNQSSDQNGQPSSQATEQAQVGKDSYGQILKSSALVGGSSIVNIAIGVVRTKAMATLLGPAGYGYLGLYGSIANLTQSIAAMGVNSSGVRQIAAAVGSGDAGRIALTTFVLRRTSIVLGTLGALLLILFSRPVSTMTFRSDQHAAAVCLLSISVFLQVVSWGQGALIQGMRRIGDLARMQVFGAFFGTLIGIPLVYYLRENGVVPSLVGIAFMNLVASWWHSRKVHLQAPRITASQAAREAADLLKLGSAFAASGFMTAGVAYAVRIMVLGKVGLAASGYYQSAWTLGGLYAGIILQAMGADFYPRLTAAVHDHSVCNRLVNEQTRVGLLLAGPGMLAALAFTPLVIRVFYSANFLAAVEVLRWLSLGTTLQVITWPMGFIIVAKGRQALFFGTELAWASASLVLAWASVKYFGLTGAGIAFFASYVFYGILLYPVVHKLTGFRWSPANVRTGLFFLCLIAAMFCSVHVLPTLWAVVIGAIATLVSGVYSFRILSAFVAWERIPPSLRYVLAPFLRLDSTLKQSR